MSIDAVVEPVAPTARRSRRFFVGMAALLALIVFVGFAPSFYLRTQFGRPALPSTLVYVHGLLFTAWLAVFLFQTSLVATGRVRLHRQAGTGGTVLALVMVVVGCLVQIDHTRRAIASGTYRVALENFLFVSSMLSIVVFAVLVSAAVYLRRNPEAHKRLLLCATIALVFPALGRFPGALTLGPLAPLILTNLLLVPLIGYDLLQRARLHPATVFGSAAVLSLLAIASTPLVVSDSTDRFVRWFAS
jgi:hypothetical protein